LRVNGDKVDSIVKDSFTRVVWKATNFRITRV